MTTHPLDFGRPVQVAYAVPDARAAAERWAGALGAGPFYLAEHIAVTDVEYRGQPATFDHTSAYGQWGDVMVELVQDHGTGPSVVRDLYPADAGGLHHVAFIVDDLDGATAAAEANDWPLAMTARAGTTTFRFMDATAELGHFVELYASSPGLVGFYAMVREAAVGWDGSDPVRSR